MKKPTQCALWERPELAVDGERRDRFEVLDTYANESHLSRHLLKCRECGQLYFFEFYEEVDWLSGNDPQYTTFIPVETKEEIEMVRKTSSLGLLQFFPRLQKDFPSDAKKPTLHWVGK